MRAAAVCGILWLGLCGPGRAAERGGSSGGGSGGGQLDAVREAVHGSGAPSGGTSSGGTSSGTSSAGSSDGETSYAGGVGSSTAAASPQAAPRATLHMPPIWAYLGYPYRGGAPGHLWLLDAGAAAARVATPPRDLSLLLFAEDSYDFRGVNRLRAGARLETRWVLGVEGRFTHLYEFLPEGRRDQLFLGDLNVLATARWDRLVLWAGIGGQLLLDAAGATLGAGSTFGLCAFPLRPMVLETGLDLGLLGAAGVVRAQVKLGAVLSRVEPYAGFDLLSIGAVRFYGPLLGLRVWAY